MTRDEADQVVVYLSATYGPWSDTKKAFYAGDIADLPFDRTWEAAHEWVKGNPGNRWPGPGDIRQLTSRIIGRQTQLRLTDERQSGTPVPHDVGLKFFREMRERLESRGKRGGEPVSLGDMLPQPPKLTEDDVADIDF